MQIFSGVSTRSIQWLTLADVFPVNACQAVRYMTTVWRCCDTIIQVAVIPNRRRWCFVYKRPLYQQEHRHLANTLSTFLLFSLYFFSLHL